MFLSRKNLTRAVAGALAIAALALSAGVATARPGEATASVNVRTGPSTSYSVVDQLYPGERVDIQQCTGGWCFVAHAGPDGWVSDNYLAERGYARPPAPPVYVPPPIIVRPPIYQRPPYYDRRWNDRRWDNRRWDDRRSNDRNRDNRRSNDQRTPDRPTPDRSAPPPSNYTPPGRNDPTYPAHVKFCQTHQQDPRCADVFRNNGR